MNNKKPDKKEIENKLNLVIDKLKMCIRDRFIYFSRSDMAVNISSGFGGIYLAFLRVLPCPPIQFCEYRNSPGFFSCPRALSKRTA